MGRDSYFEQEFCCPNCNTRQSHWTWLSTIETKEIICVNKATCKYKGSMEPIEKKVETTFAYNNLTRQEIQKERKQRSRDHFKKEVLPTIAPDFAGKKLRKKYGYKS